jgi:hypothetical protein
VRAESVRRRLARAAFVALLAAAASASDGCGIGGLRPIRSLNGESEERITEEELSERLDRFTELYAQQIIEGVRALTADEKDPALQRAALVWQINSIRTCRNSVLAPDPQTAFADIWVLCVQQREFVTTDAYAKRFGPQGRPLADAARSLEEEIALIGAGFLSKDELEKARADVEAFAKKNPIREGFARSAPLPSTAGGSGASSLKWVTAVPMAPFKFVTGIDEGAAAIRHFSGVTERFARRIDSLPQETLWEMQLLLRDVEQQQAIQRTVASLESAAKTGESVASTARDFQATSDRLAGTVAALPEDLRKQCDDLLAAIDARQADLRSTIGEFRRALADAREIVEKSDAAIRDAQSAGAGFDSTAKSIGDAGRALEGAVKAYQSMMREIHPPDAAPKPHDPNERPFDVLDWQKTADAIAKAAAELRGALGDVQALAKDDRLAQRAATAAAAARAETDAAVDHAFVRALELVAAIGVLVVVLRFIRPRRAAA